MPSTTVLVTPKQSDASVFTASDAVGSAGASNLQDQRPRLRYQSTSPTPYVRVNAGTPRAWDALVLGYFNGQASDTIRLRAATSEANLTASPGYDSAVLNPAGVPAWPAGSDLAAYRYPHRIFVFSPGGSYQWWQVDFAWGTNTDGYVRGGRLMLGTKVSPEVGVAPEWEHSHDEPVIETEDMDGGQTARPRGARRSASVRWARGALSKAEAAAIHRLLLERGSGRDLALCIDTAELEHPMSVLHIGRVKSAVSVQQSLVRRRATALNIEELAVTEMR